MLPASPWRPERRIAICHHSAGSIAPVALSPNACFRGAGCRHPTIPLLSRFGALENWFARNFVVILSAAIRRGGNAREIAAKVGGLPMRGYFAIGAERISKQVNLGNLTRSAQAFGASFVFTIDAHRKLGNPPSDTSSAKQHVPYFAWTSIEEMILPENCRLTGIELVDEAIDLPSFRHPRCAAYILGPERGSLSPEVLRRCDHVVKIPTRFCINLAVAGAIVMYDRVKTLGSFPPRPVTPHGTVEPYPEILGHGGIKRDNGSQ